jgi:hypothetical protein
MQRMTDSPRSPTPGERRLDRPPSERYRDADPGTAAPTAPSTGSPVRGLVWAGAAGAIGAFVTIVLGGFLSQTAGLLAVAAATGWAIGTASVAGARTMDRRTRMVVSVGIAVVAVIVAQLGLWLYAASEGGVLSLPEYLGQTFGLLVPLQAVLAVGLAWWAAR